MPLYDYCCRLCRHRLQKTEPMAAPATRPCTKFGCRGIMHRLIGPVAVRFKGPGFHVNDYPKGRP